MIKINQLPVGGIRVENRRNNYSIANPFPSVTRSSAAGHADQKHANWKRNLRTTSCKARAHACYAIQQHLQHCVGCGCGKRIHSPPAHQKRAPASLGCEIIPQSGGGLVRAKEELLYGSISTLRLAAAASLHEVVHSSGTLKPTKSNYTNSTTRH